MKQILTQSKDINHEYCASVVKIGELTPIKDSDFLLSTYINGKSIVVRKDEVKEGDVVFYADNETVLNEKFLGINNLYEIHDYEKNANKDEINALLTEKIDYEHQLETKNNTLYNANTNDVDNETTHAFIENLNKEIEDLHSKIDLINSTIKGKIGFFTKQSRVRMIKLRGCPSMGFIFGKKQMELYCPEVANLNLEDYIGKDFDTVNGELFIKVYVPYTPEKHEHNKDSKYKPKKKRFNRVIPGQFAFHYDTQPLGKNTYRLNPDTVVTLTTKIHGTSAIFSKCKVKRPINIDAHWTWLSNILTYAYHKYVPIKYQKTVTEYDYLYSSRSVIKNQYINQADFSYYKTDVWQEYNEIIKPYLENGMTIYGEIFGYVTGSQKMIQKDYDYGCQVGKNKLMPYRITTKQEDGTTYEWEVVEVKEWTEKLINEHPELKDKIFTIDILYHGTLQDLYPNLDTTMHWQENVLQLLSKEDKFFMEKKEPLCKNKVPREGIVLRIYNDPMKEAFKLKTNAFALKERDLIDKGEVDMEMKENENY